MSSLPFRRLGTISVLATFLATVLAAEPFWFELTFAPFALFQLQDFTPARCSRYFKTSVRYTSPVSYRHPQFRQIQYSSANRSGVKCHSKHLPGPCSSQRRQLIPGPAWHFGHVFGREASEARFSNSPLTISAASSLGPLPSSRA
jgi:hypothetical protein